MKLGIKTICLCSIAGAVVATGTPGLLAQMQKSLKFIPEVVDFGQIREEDGVVNRSVMAVNVTDSAIFIKSARTSCGCTTADFSDAPIAPGDTTIISVGYDPRNRPGKFLKTAKIFTGEERIPNSFRLSGNVIPSRRNLDKTYPDSAGSLRLSAKIIHVGEIGQFTVRPVFIGLYNDSAIPVKLTCQTDTPALEGAFAPDSLDANGVATLTLTLRAKELPPGTAEFTIPAHIVNSSSGDTIVSIPVGGVISK